MIWGSSYRPQHHQELLRTRPQAHRNHRYEVISDDDEESTKANNHTEQLLQILKKNGPEFCAYRCPCGELNSAPSKKVKIKVQI